MANNPIATPGLTPCFVDVDVDDKEQYTLFHHQRVICGWKYDVVDAMFEQVRNKERLLFWVCIPSKTETAMYVSKGGTRVVDEHEAGLGRGEINPKDWVKMPLVYAKATGDGGGGDGSNSGSASTSTNTSNEDNNDNNNGREGLLPVGQISIDFRDFETIKTPLLGSPDCSGAVVSITTLFILPSYRKHGLARWAMFEAERLIRLGLPGKVKCEQIGLSTLSERHWTMPGPDGMGMWTRSGLKGVGLRGDGIESKYLGGWYKSLGYEKVSDGGKFHGVTVTGEPVLWWGEIWSKNI